MVSLSLELSLHKSFYFPLPSHVSTAGVYWAAFGTDYVSGNEHIQKSFKVIEFF